MWAVEQQPTVVTMLRRHSTSDFCFNAVMFLLWIFLLLFDLLAKKRFIRQALNHRIIAVPQIHQTWEDVKHYSLKPGGSRSTIQTDQRLHRACELPCTSMGDILGSNSFSVQLVVGNRCAGGWRGQPRGQPSARMTQTQQIIHTRSTSIVIT